MIANPRTRRVPDKREPILPATRIIELLVCLLVAFAVITLVSFLSLRPTLKEIRAEAQAEWASFLRQVKERNELLPALVEAFKGVEPGHGKLTDKILEARSISMRSTDPATIVASVDDIDRGLKQIERIAESRPELDRYPPFVEQWKRALRVSRRIAYTRRAYNDSVRLYNRLLLPFPQNILTVVLGFVPLREYPVGRTIGEGEQ